MCVSLCCPCMCLSCSVCVVSVLFMCVFVGLFVCLCIYVCFRWSCYLGSVFICVQTFYFGEENGINIVKYFWRKWSSSQSHLDKTDTFGSIKNNSSRSEWHQVIFSLFLFAFKVKSKTFHLVKLWGVYINEPITIKLCQLTEFWRWKIPQTLIRSI